MAKLEGVKTLDMVGGHITKVEYNGAVYEKVEGDAKEGDLIYIARSSPISDTLPREFYSVVNDPIYGGIAYIDEEGDECFVDGPTSNVFRKVSAPTIESVDAKVDALTERVDALESAESAPTFKEGDRVKALADGEFSEVLSGEIGEIADMNANDGDEDDPYSITVRTGDNYDYFCPQDLELVTEDDEEETERPTVGDVVKVVRDESGHRAKIGDVVTIVEDEHDDHPYKCKFLDGTHAGWFYESEVEKISGTKPWKKGDKVRNKRSGKIVEVYAYQPKKRTTGLGAGQSFVSAEKGFTYIDEDGDESWSLIEHFELIEEKPTLKVGDYAKVAPGGKWHGMDVGDIVEVLVTDNPGGTQPIIAKRLTDGCERYFEVEQLVKATDDEVKFAKIGRKPGEFKEGDIFTYESDTHGRKVVYEVDSVDDKGFLHFFTPNFGENSVNSKSKRVTLVVPVESRVDTE